MKAIILAAGYATRLQPLTSNFPKPLLPIDGREILSHIVDKISMTEISDIVLVTNHKHHQLYKYWQSTYDAKGKDLKIEIVDDGTTSNEDRLGAIGDLRYAIEKLKIHDNLFVLAADNLFDFKLTDFIRFFYEKKTAAITYTTCDDIEFIKRYSCMRTDADGKVTEFTEKPKEPFSKQICPPFYLFPNSINRIIATYLSEKNNPDAPGYLIQWLSKKQPVHAFRLDGNIYDIGNIDSYNETNRIFSERRHKG